MSMTGTDTPTKRYIGTKIVHAEPMDEHTAFDVRPGGDHARSSNRDGYRVVYEDGYRSWSPKDVFDEAYRPCDAMTFGLALEAMKIGKRVRRREWDERTLYIHMPGNRRSTIVLQWVSRGNLEDFPYIISLRDALTDDWMIVE